jgi:hypothetical protein
MNSNCIALALVINLSIFGHALADAPMQPGAWEMRMQVTARNPETGQTQNISDTTTKLCLSAAFVAKNPYLTPAVDQEKAAKRGAKCTIGDEQKSANAASWRMDCKMQNGAETKARVSNTATAKEMRSEILQDVIQGGNTLPTVILTTGKHIGECTPEMPQL